MVHCFTWIFGCSPSTEKIFNKLSPSGQARSLLSGRSMSTSSWKFRVAAAILTSVVASGCAATSDSETDGEESGESRASNLSSAQRRDRAQHLRDVSFSRGLNNGWMIAGIAQAETQMSHCWSELTWACKGPASADCGGGPVVSGAGDGPCYLKEGGLGMFQFDAGTHTQTLAQYGNKVLTVDGNIDQAITYAVNMVIRSDYIANVTTESEAIAWMNSVTVGGAAYDTWIKTVTHYYNGCKPSYSCYSQRFAHYDDSTRLIHGEMGTDFWKGQAQKPLEIYWARRPDGKYDLRALGPAEVVKVRYLVDDYQLAEAPRDDPKTAEVEDNFPAQYTFKNAIEERHFEVLGYDKSGLQIARGVGLIDSIPGTAVYIRQMGDHLYEIGLEREPDEVAAIEVRVDGYLLTDSETGAQRSARNAVRYKFNTLGERSFDLSTFNADGSLRGHLYRDFKLE